VLILGVQRKNELKWEVFDKNKGEKERQFRRIPLS